MSVLEALRAGERGVASVGGEVSCPSVGEVLRPSVIEVVCPLVWEASHIGGRGVVYVSQ